LPSRLCLRKRSKARLAKEFLGRELSVEDKVALVEEHRDSCGLNRYLKAFGA
jgi:hypothetical protein